VEWVDTTRVRLLSAAGVWTDITRYLRFTRADFRVFRGRANEQDAMAPGTLTLGLDNASGLFTPGVASAALSLTLGMPIQVVDTIGYRTFPIFTGTLEMPDSTEVLQGYDNVITVAAVDRKQLLDNARTFISTLAEHILYHGGTALVGYWPMLDEGLPFGNVTATSQPPMGVTTTIFGGVASATTTGAAKITPRGGTGPRGDDGRPALIETSKWSSPAQTAAGVGLTSNATAVIHPGQVVTLAAWYTPQINVVDPFVECLGILAGTSTDYLQFGLIFDTTTTIWTATVGSGAGPSGTMNIIAPLSAISAPFPIAIRYGYSPSVFEVWMNATRWVGALSGSAPVDDTTVFTVSLLQGRLEGSVGHAQLYAGAAGDFDFTAWQAQIAAAGDGLSGQRTDERIRTILTYASSTAIPAVLDEGSTYMQRASLAGRRPGQLIDDAVATERGRFFVDGAGIATFHARTRAYNL
jgi:hypothetical protein